jgi:hypothetical protein
MDAVGVDVDDPDGDAGMDAVGVDVDDPDGDAGMDADRIKE